jgi:hypothetical protein
MNGLISAGIAATLGESGLRLHGMARRTQKIELNGVTAPSQRSGNGATTALPCGAELRVRIRLSPAKSRANHRFLSGGALFKSRRASEVRSNEPELAARAPKSHEIFAPAGAPA